MQVTKTVRLAAGAETVEEAITTALARAAESTRGITSFKVVEVGGRVDDSGVPAEYQVTIDVSFIVKDIAETHGP
jgi:flavin-binding protein dodecin